MNGAWCGELSVVERLRAGLWHTAAAVCLLAALLPAAAQTARPAAPAAAASAKSAEPVNFGPYVPTPWPIVDRLLAMAEIRADDYVIDLGSGDGRLVLTAARRFGASGFGIDIQERLIKLANETAAKEGLASRVSFRQGDLFEADISRATVVTLYLLPGTVTKLVPKFLADLKPGTRIVSHDYPLSPLPYDKVDQFEVAEKEKISGTPRTVLYLYIVPARVGGDWEIALPAAAATHLALTPGAPKLALNFSQGEDRLAGEVVLAGRRVLLTGLSLRGEQLRFTVVAPRNRVLRFAGAVRDGRISGGVEVEGAEHPWDAARAAAAARK